MNNSTHICDPLFNFLVGGVSAQVKDAFGEVMDETNSLSDADLLLLGQLVSEATLSWGGMVHLHRLLALLGRKQQKTIGIICEESLHRGKTLAAPFELRHYSGIPRLMFVRVITSVLDV